MKNSFVIAVLFLLIGVGIGYVVISRSQDQSPQVPANTTSNETPSQAEADLYPGWATYRHGEGLFSFRIPPGYEVSASSKQILISEKSKEANPSPTPSLSVQYTGTSIKFQTWEDMEWKYYEDVVNSFEFLK